MGKKKAGTPLRHRLREHHAHTAFDEIKKRVENALAGKGVSPEINSRGEVIFQKKEKTEGLKQKPPEGKKGGEGKGFKFGIPELDRILEEKTAPAPPQIARIRTGIPGLDELITGGIPRDSTIAVVGSPGAGKTIFGLQFLYNGASLFQEPGIYISFEEEPENIMETASLFGWDYRKLAKQGKLQVLFKDPYEIKSFASAMGGQIYATIRESKARRIVIDSITYFSLAQENQFKLRKEISELRKRLKAMDVTTLLVSEVPENAPQATVTGDHLSAEEFAVDGVVRLHNLLVRGTRQRAIEILKLRKTSHDTFLHPFSITDNGIIVYPKEQVFSE